MREGEGWGRVQSLYITTRKSRDFILLQVHVFSQYMIFLHYICTISALYHDSAGPMVVKSVAFVLPNSSRSIKKCYFSNILSEWNLGVARRPLRLCQNTFQP